jgi:hypothetical protein
MRSALLLALGIVLGAVPSGQTQENPYLPKGAPNPYLRGQPEATPKSGADLLSGKTLNDRLAEIRKLNVKDVTDVPLADNLLRRINVATGKDNPALALLRRAGQLDWPDALQTPALEVARKRLEASLVQGVKEVRKGKVRDETLKDVEGAVKEINKGLVEKINDVSPHQYIPAKRFLTRLAEVPKALSHPGIGADLDAVEGLVAEVKTVAGLVQYFDKKGLHFAPAVPGDEEAYFALDRALATYAERARARLEETKKGR